MGDEPGGEARSADIDKARREAFALFVLEKYHRDTAPIIKNFLAFSRDSGQVASTTPSYEIFDVVSNEIRNAMDHLGRSCDETQIGSVNSHIRMAEWHLDLALIRALMPIIENGQDLLQDVIDYIRLKNLKELDTEDLVKISEWEVIHESSVNDVINKIRPAPGSREVLTPPSDLEMNMTRTIAETMAATSYKYTELTNRLWVSRTLPNSVRSLRFDLIAAADEANRIARDANRRRFYRRIAYGIIGVVFFTGLSGAYGNFTYAAIKKAIEYYCGCRLPPGW